MAIKFLPRQFIVSDDDRKRFKIEAKAAAMLNHPNIATIYAIEEVDNEIFIIMEYIEGQNLKRIISKILLNMDVALEISLQIASGIKAAHRKGVIHRNIKSANIMLTGDNRVKIMDFGLAKVKGSVDLTKSGTVVGTVAYMSPEQIRG